MLHFNRYLAVIFLVFIFSTGHLVSLFAHCQIPCGIYTDNMRIEMIQEHLLTIEKSMNQIVELSKEGDKNYNQLVRWINNKDEHANYIQEIVDKYFLTQRVKPVDPSDQKNFNDYTQKLVILHQMLVFAMKTKQTTDLQNVEKLRELVNDFVKLYFDEEEQKHLLEHHN
jgi:nickel superoxide dismutase